MNLHRNSNLLVSVSSPAVLNSEYFAAARMENTNSSESHEIGELTEAQQNHGQEDLSNTRQVLRDLLKDSELSVYAEDVKIMTINGW